VREQAFGLDRAPQRRFASRAHRIGRSPQVGKAERAQVIRPFLVRAEVPRSMTGEPVDDVLRQIGAAHIGDRGGIDHIARRAAEQSAQESQTRLARPGAERGEPVGADMGGETAFARMARPGVVDGDKGRLGKPRPQHSLVLGAEAIQLRGQQPHHLTFGDRQAQTREKRHDPFAGHLALKMQHQHETMQMRAPSAHDPRPEWRNQRFAVRRLPALPPIKRRLSLRHQVLNGDLLIALEARAHWGLDPQRHLPVDRKLGDARAASSLQPLVLPALRTTLRPFRRFLHPGRLVRRARRQMFQPRDLVLQDLVLNPLRSQRRAEPFILLPQTRHLANQSANQAHQPGRRHAFKRINRAKRHA
jgi:hypothetical protein